jgi:hypothetical protein
MSTPAQYPPEGWEPITEAAFFAILSTASSYSSDIKFFSKEGGQVCHHWCWHSHRFANRPAIASISDLSGQTPKAYYRKVNA